MNLYFVKAITLIGFLAFLNLRCSHSVRISQNLTLIQGAVNSVIVEKEGKKLVIYGDPDNVVKRTFRVKISEGVPAGISLLTFDVKSDEWDFHEWAEGLVEISN